MNNIVEEDFLISRSDRNQVYGHNSFCLFFTGLSGAGKSTLAKNVEYELFSQGLKTYALDGDNTRKGLNADLGFSKDERAENIRRIGELSKILVDSGTIVTASFIAPYQRERDLVRTLLGEDLVEVYVSTPLSECESRDVKGLYKKARKGEIKGFTGIDDPYEIPQKPEIEINTSNLTLEQGVSTIMSYLKNNDYL